jgi:hypothetical protein
MEVCEHAGTHPQLVLRGSSPAVVPVRATTHEFTVRYGDDWFTLATRHGFLGLFQLFFPNAHGDKIDVVTCGAHPSGRGWGTATFDVYVYPDDTFKLSLSLPAFRSGDRGRAGGRVGDARFQEQQRQSLRRGETSSVSTTTYTEAGRQTTVERSTVQDRSIGIQQTITRSGSAERNVIVESPASSPVYQRALRSITLKRNGSDVSDEFRLQRFITAVQKFRDVIAQLIDIFRRFGEMFPEIGWRWNFGFELFSGSLAIEWQWREHPRTHRAWKYIKVSASLTVVKLTLTVSFGIKILSAVARVVVEIEVELKLQTETATSVDRWKGFEVGGVADGTGTLRAEAGWEGTLHLQASVATGLKLSTTMRWSPQWAWLYSAKRKKAEGKVQSTVLGWTIARSWTFWEDRDFVKDRSLLST